MADKKIDLIPIKLRERGGEVNETDPTGNFEILEQNVKGIIELINKGEAGGGALAIPKEFVFKDAQECFDYFTNGNLPDLIQDKTLVIVDKKLLLWTGPTFPDKNRFILNDPHWMDVSMAIRGPEGEQGEQGEKGVGIADIKIVKGEVIVTYTDGTIRNAGKVQMNEVDLTMTPQMSGELGIIGSKDILQNSGLVIRPAEPSSPDYGKTNIIQLSEDIRKHAILSVAFWVTASNGTVKTFTGVIDVRTFTATAHNVTVGGTGTKEGQFIGNTNISLANLQVAVINGQPDFTKIALTSYQDVWNELPKFSHVIGMSSFRPEAIAADAFRGPEGREGPAGEQGPAGHDGNRGPRGDAGPRGHDGDRGPIGPQGPKGDSIDASSLTPEQLAHIKGPKGDDGPRGEKGPAGEQGPRGNAGQRGIQGEQGPAGAVGPRGVDGPQGPAGADGAKGADGKDGADGQEGKQGPKGNDGLGLSYKGDFVSGTTYANGDYVADKDNQGNDHFWVYHTTGAAQPSNVRPKDDSTHWVKLSGAQGPTGRDGKQGKTGPAGPQGETGLRGPQGERGPAGADGAAGGRGMSGLDGRGVAGISADTSDKDYTLLTIIYTDGTSDRFQVKNGEKGQAGKQGPQGERGYSGADGAQGPQGDRGPRGITGDQGPQGDTGRQGPAGAQGPAGKDGRQGPQGEQGPAGNDGLGLVYKGKFKAGTVYQNGDYVGDFDDQGKIQLWVFHSEAAPAQSNVRPKDDPTRWTELVGTQGPAGPTGKDGAQGPAGKDGAQGPAGKDGERGLRGPEGPRGLEGPQGVAGPAGDRGPRGYQGEAGAQGPTGKQGDRGIGISNVSTSMNGAEIQFDFQFSDGNHIKTTANLRPILESHLISYVGSYQGTNVTNVHDALKLLMEGKIVPPVKGERIYYGRALTLDVVTPEYATSNLSYIEYANSKGKTLSFEDTVKEKTWWVALFPADKHNTPAIEFIVQGLGTTEMKKSTKTVVIDGVTYNVYTSPDKMYGGGDLVIE